MKKIIFISITIFVIVMAITICCISYASNSYDMSDIIQTREEIDFLLNNPRRVLKVAKAPSISSDIIDIPLPIEREEPAMVISSNWETNEVIIKLVESEEIFSFYEEEGANDWFARDGAIVTINDNGTPWNTKDDLIVDARYESEYNCWFNLAYDEWREYATPEFTEEEVALCAGVIAHEANSSWISTEERACIVWSILNRLDDTESYDFRKVNSIKEVIQQKGQMTCYYDKSLYDPFIWIAEDVLWRHQAEREGLENVGRILPKEYRFWWGDGHNHFRITNDSYIYWDYSLPSPYDN